MTALTGTYDKQKEAHGRWATIAWIASGLYVYISNGGLGSLFSLSALAFFGIGMFVAALVFGALGYLVQRSLAKFLMTVIKGPSGSATALIGVLGWALFLAETVLVFLAAQWTHGLIPS